MARGSGTNSFMHMPPLWAACLSPVLTPSLGTQLKSYSSPGTLKEPTPLSLAVDIKQSVQPSNLSYLGQMILSCAAGTKALVNTTIKIR